MRMTGKETRNNTSERPDKEQSCQRIQKRDCGHRHDDVGRSAAHMHVQEHSSRVRTTRNDDHEERGSSKGKQCLVQIRLKTLCLSIYKRPD